MPGTEATEPPLRSPHNRRRLPQGRTRKSRSLKTVDNDNNLDEPLGGGSQHLTSTPKEVACAEHVATRPVVFVGIYASPISLVKSSGGELASFRSKGIYFFCYFSCWSHRKFCLIFLVSLGIIRDADI